MKNKEANLRLIKRISELKDGTYNVNTSNGNFKIETSGYSYMITDSLTVEDQYIKIEDEKGRPFSRYCYFYRSDNKLSSHIRENEIDYSNEFKLENGYYIDYQDNCVRLYTNNGDTEFYLIDNDNINYGVKLYRCIEEFPLATIKENTISNDLLTIDLNNFDKIVNINGNKVIISKEKDIEQELTKYLDIKKGNDIKNIEKNLIKLYKLYLEAMKILNYTHDLNIMREIIFNLNPEFNKLYKYKKCIKKDTIVNETLDSIILSLKCGLYFVKTEQGLMQIDILKDGYCISDESGNIIKEIKDIILTNELIDGLSKILEEQKEKELRKNNILKKVKKLEKENK